MFAEWGGAVLPHRSGAGGSALELCGWTSLRTGLLALPRLSTQVCCSTLVRLQQEGITLILPGTVELIINSMCLPAACMVLCTVRDRDPSSDPLPRRSKEAEPGKPDKQTRNSAQECSLSSAWPLTSCSACHDTKWDGAGGCHRNRAGWCSAAPGVLAVLGGRQSLLRVRPDLPSTSSFL